MSQKKIQEWLNGNINNIDASPYNIANSIIPNIINGTGREECVTPLARTIALSMDKIGPDSAKCRAMVNTHATALETAKTPEDVIRYNNSIRQQHKHQHPQKTQVQVGK